MAAPAGGARPATSDHQAQTFGVSVVLPCLDEADSVGACVREARAALDRAGMVGEVIIVDNGSTDGSPEFAAKAGARVIHEARQGYGNALRAGFEAARGDVIVMADADATYPLDRLPELVAPIARDEADLVLGARLTATTRHTMPVLHRYLGTPVITWLTARACGRRVVSDSQSGFRAFRRDRLGLLGLRGAGMELATEMLIRSARVGLRIHEVDTGYRPRIGESKLDTWSDGRRHLMLLLMLAPDLLLVGPGVALVALGAAMLGLSLISPEGVEVGSLLWQPVFFAGIALVLGTQALLAGVVLAHGSTVSRPGVERRFRFVGHPRFRRRCFATGVAMIGLGLAIDAVVFVLWVGGDPSPPDRGLGYAAMAQSLIITGGTLVTFSVVSHFQLRQRPM